MKKTITIKCKSQEFQFDEQILINNSSFFEAALGTTDTDVFDFSYVDGDAIKCFDDHIHDRYQAYQSIDLYNNLGFATMMGCSILEEQLESEINYEQYFLDFAKNGCIDLSKVEDIDILQELASNNLIFSEYLEKELNKKHLTDFIFRNGYMRFWKKVGEEKGGLYDYLTQQTNEYFYKNPKKCEEEIIKQINKMGLQFNIELIKENLSQFCRDYNNANFRKYQTTSKKSKVKKDDSDDSE